MLDYMLPGTALALMTTLPLVWKWRLGVRRTACAVVALGMLASLLVAFLGSFLPIHVVLRTGAVWLLTLAAAAAALAYRFYRDPERSAPDLDDVIVSPADGEVIYVRESRGGRLPVSTKHGRDYPLQELTKTPLRSEEAVVIGIAMSF